jgi:hypothetical protein
VRPATAAAARLSSLFLVLLHPLAPEHHLCSAPQTTTHPAHRAPVVYSAALGATRADRTSLEAAHRAHPRASPAVFSAEVKQQPARRQHQPSAARLEDLDRRRKAIHPNQLEDYLAMPGLLQVERLRPRSASNQRVSILVQSRCTTPLFNTTHRFDANSHTRSKQDVIPPFHHPSRCPSRKQHLRSNPGERRCPIRRLFVRPTEQPRGLNSVFVWRREASRDSIVFYTWHIRWRSLRTVCWKHPWQL